MRNTSSLTGALLVFLCAPVAFAAGTEVDSSGTQKARASFHQGVQLYNEGSFEAALAEFKKAYQLSPNYRLLYNIGQTQYDLHDYVAASRSLEQYLREGGSEISAERRTQVTDLNRKAEERVAYVDVACNVEGAELRVDDVPVGVSPLSAPVPVNAGPRRISAVKAGYAPAARTVTVAGTEKIKVAMEIAETSDLAEGSHSGAGDGDMVGSIHQKDSHKKKASRALLISSSVVAGGCAVTTGILAIIALQAKNDFNAELAKVPNTRNKIDDARSKMKLYANATDAFAVATLLSAGVVLYAILTDSADSDASKSSKEKKSVAIAPTVGGLLIQGTW